MVRKRTGDGWTVEVNGTIMVWEFLPGMELSAFGEDAYPVFEELLGTLDLDGMVTEVRMDDPFNSDAFEIWEKSAQRADRAGVDRWAVVADGIKAISLRGKVDTGTLETLTTENRSDAIEWAQG